jgi:hypothetical protein
MQIPRLKNLVVFILLFLIISSTLTFPALAAEQLGGESANPTRLRIFNWLRNLLNRLFGNSPEMFIANTGGAFRGGLQLGLDIF